MIAVNTQTLIFLQSLILGAVLGVGYDMFRILRIALPMPAGVIIAEDILYFLAAGFVTFFFTMSENYGQVRFFILLGELLGFVLYYFTLGALIIKGAEKIIAAVKWVFRQLFRFFIRPVLRFGYWVFVKIKKMCLKIALKGKKTLQKQRNHLKTKQILVYNYFRKKKRPASPKKRLTKKKKNKPKRGG